MVGVLNIILETMTVMRISERTEPSLSRRIVKKKGEKTHGPQSILQFSLCTRQLACVASEKYGGGNSGSATDYNIDVRGLAKHLGIDVVEYKFSKEISGVYFRKGNEQFIGVNKSHHEHRKRFTIAHQIGYSIMHPSEILHYDLGLEYGGHFLHRTEDAAGQGEVEANQFAAELLMPEDSIKEIFVDYEIGSAEEMAGEFDVSADAMRYRLVNLGYL
jgi:Zn-dependent peptidase ImmA (M78 family)